MAAKTYDRQTAKFLAVVGENMPELSGDAMQGWIQNPKAVQKALSNAFCPPGVATVPANKLVFIDRTVPFDSVKFLGKGWTIEEQDERSLGLDQVDLTKVQLEHMIKHGETRIKGEEKLERLKTANYIRLDAKVFQTLWENQALIPGSWQQKTSNNTTFIFFDGTVFRGPGGSRCVLYLCWRDGQWRWDYYWLEDGWRVHGPSAVLASI